MKKLAYSKAFDEMINYIPLAGETQICWENFEKSKLGFLLRQMGRVQQNPTYHAEGDVYTHTKLVCEELIKLDVYRESTKEDKIILFLSALLHDAGKIKCTKIQDGEIVSPYHSVKGVSMVRELLWRDFGLCGSEEKQQLREAVCLLIRYHGFPPHVIFEHEPEYKLLRVACSGQLAKAFNLKKLCALSLADALGRKTDIINDYPEAVNYCMAAATEFGCLESPHSFKDSFSQRAYFLKKTDWCNIEMYNDTWGTVTMLSGLPGTGKDTWISENRSDLPVVSLDEIRKQLNVLPTDDQSAVIAFALNKAKELLRSRQPFVVNMTNLTERIRAKWITLFEQYGAGVELVFLETEWEEELRRNAERKAAVPQSVIENMLSLLEPPQPYECEKVHWIIT